ncbi:MAG: hypothetical protein QOK47_722 [Actinomycetota bacterium]|nr:hypothetical protein [Actinomycetota bacterium]
MGENQPGEEEPLDDDEREALRQDLEDVSVLKGLLGPRGIRGVVFYCPDCDEDHYLAWDLLAGNLKELLEAGESPVHEPAFEPDPDDYVSWDFARGFLDGYESSGEEWDDTVNKLVLELRDRDWSPSDVKALLAGLELTAGPMKESEDPE